MIVHGWAHNGYHDLPVSEVARRARVGGIDTVIVKHGDPAFERALAVSRVRWATERFAVANCEPNDGGGWDYGPEAATAIRTLIDAFRARHREVPLYVCADLRRGRGLDAPWVREAARGGVDAWLPMVYPKAFGQSVPAAFDAAYPGATYLGLPCLPVLQAYDGIGPAAVRAQIDEARRRGAASCSLYLLETASDDELRAAAGATRDITPETLTATALAYLRGGIAILDHGTPSELAAWGRLFAGAGEAPRV